MAAPIIQIIFTAHNLDQPRIFKLFKRFADRDLWFDGIKIIAGNRGCLYKYNRCANSVPIMSQ